MVSKQNARSKMRKHCSRPSGSPTPLESWAEYSVLTEPSLVRMTSWPGSTPMMRLGLVNRSTSQSISFSSSGGTLPRLTASALPASRSSRSSCGVSSTT